MGQRCYECNEEEGMVFTTRNNIGLVLVCEPCQAKYVDPHEAQVSALRAEVAAAREPLGFEEFVACAERFLTNYPAHVFTDQSGDPGTCFVVRLRSALETLNESRAM
jgi:hypothetical protein